jgi:hypothetical protein
VKILQEPSELAILGEEETRTGDPARVWVMNTSSRCWRNKTLRRSRTKQQKLSRIARTVLTPKERVPAIWRAF